ncbi:MAG: ATP-dependent Clp protease proteolytic subunit [Haloferula sp.]
MKTKITRSAIVSLALICTAHAQENSASATASTPALGIQKDESKSSSAGSSKSPEQLRQEEMKKEQERLALENSLIDEKVKFETAKMRAEAARLKAEKELISERLAHAAMKRKADEEAKNAKMEIERERLTREAAIAKAEAEALGSQLKALQAQHGIELAKLENQIKTFEAEKRRNGYADAKAQHLMNPLRKDGTIVISDRRIALNGPIGTSTADYVTDRIHYFNNANPEQPIFIVIDECPGGSVMAGYRILKAMDASDAPIHVVVKSFAASMAAAITTLAEESYAYPNAVILHHQISATVFGRMNLTQQKEFLEESNRWWTRLATPIADEMGITTEEFIKRMYEKSTSGDWSEFGEEAQKLKWVKHIVTGIEETSFLKSPDAKKAPTTATTTRTSDAEHGVDEDGRPVMFLPRLNPKDVYFIYNPDGYYRLR